MPRPSKLLAVGLFLVTAVVAGAFLLYPRAGNACPGRLARTDLADGAHWAWKDAKTRAIYLVYARDARTRDGGLVEEFDASVYDHEIRFETPAFMHLRELVGQTRDWYRIVRDLRHASCAGAPPSIATYRSWPQRPIDDEVYWTYRVAQQRVDWRIYWAGPTLRGLPLESLDVFPTPEGVPKQVGVYYESASMHGITLIETETGSKWGRSADAALRKANRVGPGIWVGPGRSPTAGRIGSTSISFDVEPLGNTLTRREWIAILRRLRSD